MNLSLAQHSVDMSHLSSADLADKLIENHATYHKVCRTKYNNQKIDRLARKKKPRFNDESSLMDETVPLEEISPITRKTRSHFIMSVNMTFLNLTGFTVPLISYCR